MNGAAEEFHLRGRTAVLAGQETYDQPPRVGSPRWGLSVILRPDASASHRLGSVTTELSSLAGGAHWPTGRLGCGHLTVRGLEPYRDRVAPDDLVVRRYAAAVTRAAARSSRLTFALTGLVLMPGGVLVVAEPVDEAPAELRAVLEAELGEDAAFEDAGYRRNLWWSTLLHFAEPLADGAALVAWVEDRRALDLGRFYSRSIDLVRYDYDGACTTPVAFMSVPLES